MMEDMINSIGLAIGYLIVMGLPALVFVWVIWLFVRGLFTPWSVNVRCARCQRGMTCGNCH